MLIIKQAPDLLTTGLTKAIGSPEDYNKNLEKNNFPGFTDIRIPNLKQRNNRESDISQLEDALNGFDLSDRREENKNK